MASIQHLKNDSYVFEQYSNRMTIKFDFLEDKSIRFHAVFPFIIVAFRS